MFSREYDFKIRRLIALTSAADPPRLNRRPRYDAEVESTRLASAIYLVPAHNRPTEVLEMKIFSFTILLAGLTVGLASAAGGYNQPYSHRRCVNDNSKACQDA